MTTLTLFSREYPPILLGGIGNTARYLSEELMKQDFNVNIITLKFGQYLNLPSYEKKGRIRIYRLPLRQRLMFWYKTAFFSWIHRDIMKSSDLIHLLQMRDAPFIYKEADCPLIANVNDHYPSTIPFNPFKYPYPEKNKFVKYFHYNFLKLLDFVSVQRADLVLTTGKYTAECIRKAYFLPKSRVRPMYKGINIEEFDNKCNNKCRKKDDKGDKNSCKKGRGDIGRDIDVLLVGSPLGTKGAKELIYSVSSLRKKYRDIKCAVIGRPSHFDYDYKALIEKLGVGNNIRFIGSVPHEEVIQYYLNSKIFVLPSYRDSMPQVVMEAMAAKLPVIATKVGGIPEMVTAKTGFLIGPQKVEPLTKKIDYLMENPSLRREMGLKGYERVKKYFDFKRMIKTYLKIYDEFL